MVRDGHRRNDCLDGLLGRSMNRNTLFFGTLGLFLLHQGAIAMGWMVAWADSYLDPLLFVPVALGAPGWLIRQWKVDFRWNVFFITGALDYKIELEKELYDYVSIEVREVNV